MMHKSAHVVEKCCKRTSDEIDWHTRDSEGTGQCLHLSMVLNIHYPNERGSASSQIFLLTQVSVHRN